jgi:uncharacterized protein YndB with AHSA1/START domain
MVEVSKFKPKTVYVTYIAATPQQVWDALTQPEFTRQYFAGFAIDVEPRESGAFRMLYPDGRVHIAGRVIEWSPPRRFACTWVVEGMAEFRDLPECLVTYEIEPAGESVQLTMTEAHSWDVPDDLLSGGRAGWPAILSSLKSVLETGKPLRLKMEPPKEMMAAVERLKKG